MDTALSQYLLENNLVADQALERAKRVADESREDIGAVLSKLGLVSEQDLVKSYSSLCNFQATDFDGLSNGDQVCPEIEHAFLNAVRAYPVEENDDQIRLAVANPLDPIPKSAIEYATGKTVEYLVAPLSEILHRLGDGAADELGEESSSEFDGDDLARLKDLASEAPVIRYVNRLLQSAVNMGASDIHIEPMEAVLKIRIRIDGMLEDQEDPPVKFKAAIVSRIKILAGLDIAERRLPQDGRLRMAIGGRDVDFRVSTTPTAFGESVVLRILNQHKLVLDPGMLGFPKSELPKFHKSLSKSNGIILVTGPTGSGKTTTLYTALKILNRPDRKILTIEDPIEYMLDGINQVQVNASIGLDFASALRSFLRQDPDIMMVGEIRDIETANIAVQASLTGHLILSTLHTNSAAGAITRLVDMGVEDFLLASTLNMVMAQRLVRKLCDACKRKSGDRYEPVGCAQCQNSGYKGRTMVVELLETSGKINDLIKRKADIKEIESIAQSEGMRTMLDQAEMLVRSGVTSKQEVYRVLGQEGV